jgi:hypothetical protein
MNLIIKILLNIWVGSLWWMMFVAIIIFEKIPTSFLAGKVAGELFQYLAYFGFIVVSILITRLIKINGLSFFKELNFWICFFIFSILVINYFGIHPLLEALKVKALPKEVMESVFADRFSMWHGVSSIAYLIQSVLACLLMVRWR